jgi:hypothetical protein
MLRRHLGITQFMCPRTMSIINVRMEVVTTLEVRRSSPLPREINSMVSPMELLDRAVAYTGKHVRLLRSGLVKAEDIRKAKRVTFVARHGMYCKKCGNVGPTKAIMKGSFAIELVLWLFFLLPGLIYSIWRLTTKGRGCSVCGSGDVIPANAPLAKNNMSQPVG